MDILRRELYGPQEHIYPIVQSIEKRGKEYQPTWVFPDDAIQVTFLVSVYFCRDGRQVETDGRPAGRDGRLSVSTGIRIN